MRSDRGADGYAPLDETLAKPRVRILRVLQHFGWATTEDIRIALDVPPVAIEWDRLNTATSRLTRDGHLERAGKFPEFIYRITPSGRRELQAELARGFAGCPTEEWHRNRRRRKRAA